MPEISPLDYAFLALESEENPKHVGPVQILRPPEGAPTDYVSRFVAKLRQRQPQPPFNYKLKMTVPNPLGKLPNLFGWLPNLPTTDFAMPQWSVVKEVDMEKHVFHHVLPEPGTKGQLTRKLQELHQPLIDRKRPVWECHVIEGYEGGRRFAVYIKIHHALADGALLAARLITNTAKEPDLETGKVFWESPGNAAEQKRPSENLLDDVSHMAKYMVNSTNMLGNVYMSVLRSGVGALLNTGSKQKGQAKPFSAPVTRLDKQPEAGRSLAFGGVSLARLKTLSKATGATVNDLLFTFLDMGVRQYLTDCGEKPKKRLVALMPMSLRDASDDPSQGNSVSIATVLLGRPQSPPLERLREIGKETLKVKDERQLSPESALANSLVLSGLAQLGESLKLTGTIAPLGNFVFSNVPGPRDVRYQLDARIEEIYPVSCLAPGAYMNVTVFSYAGAVYFQFVALEKAAPNLNELVKTVLDAVQIMEREVLGVTASEPGVEISPSEAVTPPDSPVAPAVKPVRTGKAASSATKKTASRSVEPATPRKTVNSSAKAKATKKPAPKPVKPLTPKRSVKAPVKAPVAKKPAKAQAKAPVARKSVTKPAKPVVPKDTAPNSTNP